MVSYTFKCHQCGLCCRNFLNQSEYGLMILPNKVNLFPEKSIQPCLGKGKSPKDKNFKIWTYQLNESCCPHLEGNSCKIYMQRPLACQAFPFNFAVSDKEQILYQVAPKCTAILEDKKSGRYKEGMISSESKEIKAANEISTWILDFKKGKFGKRAQWIYNLRTKKWGRFKVSRDRRMRVRKTFHDIKEKRTH